jgi:hypothetical protein
MTLLKAGSGNYISTSAGNLDTVAISGLSANDTILIYFTVSQQVQSSLNLYLYNDTDSVEITASGQSNMTVGTKGVNTIVIRQDQESSTKIDSSEIRIDTATYFLQSTFITAWTGSWTLALRSPCLSEGRNTRWSWTVYKMSGQ